MDTLWTALLTITGTLLGIFIGATINRQNEHKQWLRNEKIKLYSEWLDTFGNIQIDNIFRAMGEPLGDSDGEINGELFDFYNRVHEMCMRVILVAPDEIIEEVQASMESVRELRHFAGELPYDMNKKYIQPSQSEADRKSSQDAMLKDIYRQLHEKMMEHGLAGYKRLETVTNLMRDDLHVSGSVPKGILERYGLRKSDD